MKVSLESSSAFTLPKTLAVPCNTCIHHNIPTIKLISSHWIWCIMVYSTNMMYQQISQSWYLKHYHWHLKYPQNQHYSLWMGYIVWSVRATFSCLRLIRHCYLTKTSPQSLSYRKTKHSCSPNYILTKPTYKRDFGEGLLYYICT